MDWLTRKDNQDLLKGLAGNLAGQFAPPGVREQIEGVLGADQPAADAAPGDAPAPDPSAAAAGVVAQPEIGQVLIGALAASAGDGALAEILQQIGHSGTAGEPFSADQLITLATHLQQQHPEALTAIVNTVRDNPALLQSVLGNEALQGIVRSLLGGSPGGQ